MKKESCCSKEVTPSSNLKQKISRKWRVYRILFFMYHVSSRNVALDSMHNSMQVRAACALKDLLEPISMTSSENCRISLLLHAIHTLQASLRPNCEVEEWVLIQPHMGNIFERVDFVRALQTMERRTYSNIIFNPKRPAGVWWFVQIAPWIAKMTCLSKLSEREIYTQAAEIWGRPKNLVSGAGYAGCSVESNSRHR